MGAWSKDNVKTTQQRTSEWFASRKGKVTGSIAGAILGLPTFNTRRWLCAAWFAIGMVLKKGQSN